MSASLIELTYLSKASVVFTEPDLIALLQHARLNNAKRNITGILLFDGKQSFIQVLEGEKEQVEALYEIIKNDPRHSNIYQLGSRNISERTFAEWKMGFRDLRAVPTAKLSGFSGFLDNNCQTEWTPDRTSFAVQMLTYFKQEYINNTL